MNELVKKEIIKKLREIRELAEENNLEIYIEDSYTYEGIMLTKSGGDLKDYNIIVERADEKGTISEKLEIE